MKLTPSKGGEWIKKTLALKNGENYWAIKTEPESSSAHQVPRHCFVVVCTYEQPII